MKDRIRLYNKVKTNNYPLLRRVLLFDKRSYEKLLFIGYTFY